MAKRSKVIRRASKRTTREWAEGYEVPDLEEAFGAVEQTITDALETAIEGSFQKLHDGVRRSVVEAFGNFVADNDSQDLLVTIDGHDPGIVKATFGGMNSNVTPHIIETTISISDMVDWVTDGCERREYLEKLRDHLLAAAERVSKEISEFN